MNETLASGRVTLHCGDCLNVLATMPENSVDSVVCDPPYHLTSIVKRFGKEDSAPSKDGVYGRSSRGFMGKKWDGGDVAFRPETWSAVLRVLKPGGHLLAFSGTRTYHHMASAIAESGFEVRDMIAWMYGSGFPKSHDVSKSIDRMAGAEREVISRGQSGKTSLMGGLAGTCGEYGHDITAPATDAAREWQGWGSALKPALEPICLARKPLVGTIAENVLAHGTGALNIDGCRVESGDNPMKWENPRCGIWTTDSEATAALTKSDKGRWPANVTHDGSDEVLAAFPDADGAVSNGRKGKAGLYEDGIGSAPQVPSYGDSGSAARFFYTAKADGDDRLGSSHPTVKPLDLMQYLVRLVTPKGGVVLDCFAGTGTTGEAAFREGFNAVLIEREAEYQADIRRRMSLVLGGPNERKYASLKAKCQAEDAGPLFGGIGI